MRFRVINLGCKVNRVESDDFIAAFLAAGATTDNDGEVELVIINTCTVTGEAAKKGRKVIRGALRENPQARVIVTGCAAAVAEKELRALDERVEIWSKDQVIKYANKLKPETSPQQHTPLLRVGDVYPTRVNIKIQDGCNNACTYCIVHVARGPASSKSVTEVVEEVIRYENAGVREVVLTGINLGSYCHSENTITSLLQQLLSCTKEMRFRLSSVEPVDVSDALIKLLAQAEGRVCRHLHIPLQSGSSKVLAEMNRPYDAAYFENLARSLYRAMPSFSLTTDVIVGFPGETKEQFEETCRLARTCQFSKIHVFPYSLRKGTPAAERDDQVSAEEKAERARQLRSLAEKLREQDRFSRKGTVEQALIEHGGKMVTESYHHINAPDSAQAGTFTTYRW